MSYRLSIAELSYWLAKAKTVAYTTVRGAYRMAPLTNDELRQSHTVDAFLGEHEPYASYIISYGVGAFKEPHRDPSLIGSSKLLHWRLVFLLQSAEVGGYFILHDECHHISSEPLISERSSILFRADLLEHSVSTVHKGERIVLTVGKLVKP